ncbi:hypothetical protein FXF51_19545 [Nonomuraea sp. PA05]|uniref:hypothetical protein n=1 Tax=Nonomuraea sp. PA05 TaxID=2604466 RepID=UPI0011D538A0|nr:hypothetical protein [Nonomuraea sp. PA05]TYB65408.1 hypothetical protein FXF51_19545 [Nonomuraea sp. PA05]
MPDVLQSPVYLSGGAQPTQIAVMWGSERFESSVTGKWQELPGAKITWKVGPGSSTPRCILVATFTAEVIVGRPVSGGNAVGLLDITFGGENGHPQSDNHRYATAQSTEEWGSVTTLRAMNYLTGVDSMRDASPQVVFNLAQGSNFGFQNWLLKLEAYPQTASQAG